MVGALYPKKGVDIEGGGEGNIKRVVVEKHVVIKHDDLKNVISENLAERVRSENVAENKGVQGVIRIHIHIGHRILDNASPTYHWDIDKRQLQNG